MTLVPPLPAETLLHLLAGLAVLLGLARALGALAELARLPAIVGELVTGVLLGPSLLGWAAPEVADLLGLRDPDQLHLIDGVGQVGLLLLVALTGTYVDVPALRRRGRAAVAVSLGGLLVPLACGVALGVALADVLGGPAPLAPSVFPLFLGVAMCVTAIPVIAKTLSDMGLLHRNVGQLTLAAGMVDDAVGWLLLSVVSAAATTGIVLGQIGLSLALLGGFVVVAAVVGRPLVRALTALTTRTDDPRPTIALAVVLVLGCATTTQALHMEAILGAFVAGLLLAGAGRPVQERLAPLRPVVLGVLAPVFLATAGLRMDLTALARPDVLAAAAAVLAVAVVGKFAGAYLGARLARLRPWEGLALGAGMNARGVVEVIVALTGLRLGVIDQAGYTVIVLVAVVTSLMAPPLLRWAVRRIGQDEEERTRQLDHETWSGRIRTGTGPSADGPP